MTMREGRVYVVAELGINANGNLETALQMISKAAHIGCDAVKFQKRTVDVVFTKEELEKPRPNPFGETNGDLKRGLEFGQAEYDRIDEQCKRVGISWHASPWDEQSVDFLMQYDCPYLKVASACLTDVELLQKMAATKRPLLVSTGMATLETVRRAVAEIERAGGTIACIYHCTSTYPCEPEEVNVKGIRTLQFHFPDIPIGYSGHEVQIPPTLFAIAQDAAAVERHFTLDRSWWGSDQASSVEPHGMEQIVNGARMWERCKGDGEIKFYDSEKPIAEKLRRKDTLRANSIFQTER